MTEDEVRKLTPGPATDELVAEFVLGYQKVPAQDYKEWLKKEESLLPNQILHRWMPTYWCTEVPWLIYRADAVPDPRDKNGLLPLPNFSADANYAIKVISCLVKKGYECQTFVRADSVWTVIFIKGEETFPGYAVSFALAVCRAALMTVAQRPLAPECKTAQSAQS